MGRSIGLWIAAAGVAASLLAPARAEACGAFFCGDKPMDQAGEKIIFATQNGQMEAHVMITYQGEADQFAWVVPVHALPTLSVGSTAFFRYVDGVSAPTWELQWQQSATCGNGYFGGVEYSNAAGGAPVPTAPGATDAGSAVTVISQSQVGPYDSAILQATDTTALDTWLTSNGYNLTPQGQQALTPYVGQGYYFVALKLAQNETTGDIRPIVLTFAGTEPCIPIRLTAIAAQPNMPITAYVFANHRAVPINYDGVVVNETKIDWVGGGQNYTQLATAAVAEAGKHAFITEFAGATSTLNPDSTSGLGQGFYRPYVQPLPPVSQFNTAQLATITDPVSFLLAMEQQGFPRDATIQELLEKYVPEPASLVGTVSTAEFYNDIQAYQSAIQNDPNRAPFDPTDFAKDLQTLFVDPLAHAENILATYPYFTRLFTTLSPQDMTLDPDFDYNPDVGDLSNVHTAKATAICNQTDPNFGPNTVVRIDLPDGRSFYVTYGSGPLTQGPNAEFVQQFTTSGQPALLVDNSGIINKVIAPKGCACGLSGFEPGSLALLLASLGLWARRRRA